jgi:hypothetical protein
MIIIAIWIVSYALSFPSWVPVVGTLGYLLHVEIQSGPLRRYMQKPQQD